MAREQRRKENRVRKKLAEAEQMRLQENEIKKERLRLIQ